MQNGLGMLAQISLEAKCYFTLFLLTQVEGLFFSR